MKRITTCLWFDSQGEDAARFYTKIFKNSTVGKIARYPEGSPGPAGKVMTVAFTLDGHDFVALNGGPQFPFTEAISLTVNCKDQKEVDYYWDRLLAGGGKPSMCGWLKDKFGVSWQIVPTAMNKLFTGDADRAQRAMQAMLKMVKIDLPTIVAAAGAPARKPPKKATRR